MLPFGVGSRSIGELAGQRPRLVRSLLSLPAGQCEEQQRKKGKARNETHTLSYYSLKRKQPGENARPGPLRPGRTASIHKDMNNMRRKA